jgi:putative ABC transport system permease protein
MFKNRPLRTFLTVLGVGVGIGTVLFLVSFGYGLQNVILNKITTADSLLSLDVSAGTSNLVALDPDNVKKIQAIPGVQEVSRLASFSGQAAIGDQTADSAIYGIDPSLFRLGGIIVDHGSVFKDSSYKAVISSAMAKLFGFDATSVIGKKIKPTLYISNPDDQGMDQVTTYKSDNEYEVVGVVDDDATAYAFVPLDSLSDVAISKYDQLKIKVTSSDLLEPVRQKVMESGFLVSSLSDTIDQAKKIFSIVQIVLFMFGFIALIVSAIGMFNTMTISLLERTNEIGIMRSIGISAKDIRQIFLMESGLMGFLGGLGGVAVGVIAGFLVNMLFNLLASNLGGRALDLFYSPMWFVMDIIIFSAIVGLLTGVYPSIRAAKLNPLDALRYK